MHLVPHVPASYQATYGGDLTNKHYKVCSTDTRRHKREDSPQTEIQSFHKQPGPVVGGGRPMKLDLLYHVACVLALTVGRGVPAWHSTSPSGHKLWRSVCLCVLGLKKLSPVPSGGHTHQPSTRRLCTASPTLAVSSPSIYSTSLPA